MEMERETARGRASELFDITGDSLTEHTRPNGRDERVTNRASTPHGPKQQSDNMSKRPPRRTYVQARRECRSEAEGRKRGGKRVTPLGVTSPLVDTAGAG